MSNFYDLSLLESVLSSRMAKGTRGRRRIASRQCRPTPYPMLTRKLDAEDHNEKRCSKKDWEEATCSVCMEYPHNAVLLLCSSHDKGCRPYMCGTSCRYSNCLDQYKKAYTKMLSPHHVQPLDGADVSPVLGAASTWPVEKCGQVTELACPLCRGQVKGWTVVEPAREYLNAKKRTCMQENCLFVGTYKELRKHVRSEHPSARPREVDPAHEQKWRRLEREREREDVISTVTSSMPGAVVFGDYVIERGSYGLDSDEEEGFDLNGVERNNGGFDVGIDGSFVYFLMHAFGSSGNVGQYRGMRRRNDDDDDDSDDDGDGDGDGGNEGMSLVNRLRRQGRVLLGRSGRRRRRREATGERR